ncbi:MAG: NADH-quinone oxidoreductase subunit I [Deinococcus sp.]|nr:NADH-quinone oxidoreductase subunit I [Deinococcus sp.]
MGLLQDVKSFLSGFSTTMRTTLRPPVTHLYPYAQPNLPPGSHGSLALLEDDDGTERCISCYQCERVCPSRVIKIDAHKNPTGKGLILDDFVIDHMNCMYCGLCVEVCPVDAIAFTTNFEWSTYNAEEMVVHKDWLYENGRKAQAWRTVKQGLAIRGPDGKMQEGVEMP